MRWEDRRCGRWIGGFAMTLRTEVGTYPCLGGILAKDQSDDIKYYAKTTLAANVVFLTTL